MSLPTTPKWPSDDTGVPAIDDGESFGDLVDKLSQYFEHTVRLPHTFEDFRRSQQGRALHPLVAYLSSSVHHPALVSALLYVPPAHGGMHTCQHDHPLTSPAR